MDNKATATADELSQYVNDVADFVDQVAKNEMRKASVIIDRLTNIIEHATGVDKALDPVSGVKQVRALRKTLKAMTKISKSLVTGIKNSSINLGTFRTHVRTHMKPLLDEMNSELREISAFRSDDAKLNETLNSLRKQKSFMQILRSMPAGGKNSKPQKDDGSMTEKEEEELVHSYRKYRSKLPSSLRGRLFSILRMPIVPMATDFRITSPSFLRKAGVDFKYIAESFAVLEDQYLLAFDYSQAVGYKGMKKVRVSKGVNAQEPEERFVLDIIDAINKESNVKFVLASSQIKHHPNNGAVAFAWILPYQTFKMFERQGDIGAIDWGFPWARDVEDVL